MAETQTFSYQPETTTETNLDQLTPDEQDSLAVGESIAEKEEQVYAGKYKSAEDLEKAYIELQKKLGSNGEEVEEDTEQASAEEESTETPLSDGASLIASANDEYYKNDGKLSEETLEKFSSMSSKDLVAAYLEVQNTPEFQPQGEDVADLSDSDVNQLKNQVGGDAAYTDLMKWASTNLDKKSQDAFDSIVNTGSVEAIKIAVAGLKTEYDAANGVDGTMVQGKAPKTGGDVFRSQAELVRAMSDPRYDSDPAYRQDIIEKLDRSNNLQF